MQKFWKFLLTKKVAEIIEHFEDLKVPVKANSSDSFKVKKDTGYSKFEEMKYLQLL